MNQTPSPKSCPKCQSPMIAEAVGDGRTKYACPKDGCTEILDQQGRKYLADGSTPSNRRPLCG